MARHILLREGAGSSALVPEGELPSEAQLHEALASYPELVPTTDLGMGRSVLLGTEAQLDAGRADIVFLDEAGSVCVVEVKKEGNPDTRRVVAQVLDYASSIWGLSADEFAAKVVSRPDDERDLETLVADELAEADESGDPSESTERILGRLADSLSSGAFILAIAAPSIPTGVQRVIDYLGHRGISLYGIEYSYFRTNDTEVFVPRVVAGPPAAETPSPSGGLFESPKTLETLLEKVPANQRAHVTSMVEALGKTPANAQWVRYGIRFLSTPGVPSTYVLVSIDGPNVWVATHKRGRLPQELFDRVKAELATLEGGEQGREWWSIKLDRDGPALTESAIPVIVKHVARVHEAARAVE